MGDDAGKTVQTVFSYGHRNGFGMAFDPRSGHLWNTENGPNRMDEINQQVELPGHPLLKALLRIDPAEALRQL